MNLPSEFLTFPRMMVDIETLGATPKGIICSIGIGVFNVNQTLLQSEMFLDITLQPKRQLNLDTVLFWEGKTIPRGTKTLYAALNELNKIWLYYQCQEIWANGITFDISILEDAYKETELEVPWKYNQVLDLRTLKHIAGKTEFPFTNRDPHNALSDAIYQIKQFQHIYNHVL